MMRRLWQRLRRDDGMTTAEYAIGIITAVTLAGVLYKIVQSPAVVTALTGIVKDALSVRR